MKFEAAVKLMLVGFLLALLVYLGYVVRVALLLILVSMVFATIFSLWVDWVERQHVWRWSPGRGISLLIVLLVFLTALGVFLAFALPPIIKDLQGFVQNLPQSVQAVQQRVRNLPFGSIFAERLDENTIQNSLQNIVQHMVKATGNVAGWIMDLLMIAILSAYFILDGPRAFKWAVRLLPATRREHVSDTLRHSAHRMQHWLYGQLILMLILGSTSAVVFGALGLRYFYALAVFAGVANFVPILGPIATVVLASIVAALDSWTKVLGVVIFYFVYQQVETAYLTPRIMRSAVNLPGVTVLVALVIGGELAGLLGAIVAVPIAAFVATVVDEYLLRTPYADEQHKRAA